MLRRLGPIALAAFTVLGAVGATAASASAAVSPETHAAAGPGTFTWGSTHASPNGFGWGTTWVGPNR